MIRKIFVNGTFDVLHYGHIELLNYAKSLGDYLLVALDTDRRISEKKGADRPVNNQYNRVTIISNLRAVDEVKIFDSDQELIDIVRDYSPDIMIVGSDWQGKNVIGSEYARDVKFFARISDESTTKTLEGFLARRQLHR